MSHPVDVPKADYNPHDQSITIRCGAGTWHFYPSDDLTAADIGRCYHAACIQAIGTVDPATAETTT